jgi:hypothetical protein
VRAPYEFAETGEPTLSAIVDAFVEIKPMLAGKAYTETDQVDPWLIDDCRCSLCMQLPN